MLHITAWNELTDHMSTTETVLVVVNMALLFTSRWVSRWLQSAGPRGQPSSDTSVQLLRFFQITNIIIFGVVVVRVLFLPPEAQPWTTQPLSVMVVVYVGYLSSHAMRRLIDQRFGKQRQVEGATQYQETYQSRMLNLVAGALIVSLCVIAAVRLLGFESLLEAGGVLGFIGVLLALTQGAWAPDIIAGLIILNSSLVEEGDVVELEGGPGGVLGIVFKTKLFHTEILNLVNNHRVMLPNARLRTSVVHNLSKFASARGLRERLTFKIGYDEPPDRVRQMFEAAFAHACTDETIGVADQHPVEVRVLDTGDDAVEWGVFYFTKDVKQLLSTRQLFREAILARSLEMGIALSTPRLIEPVGGSAYANRAQPYIQTEG